VVAVSLVASLAVVAAASPARAAPFRWTEVHTGHASACARTNDDRWFCWGMLYDGQHRSGPPTWRYVAVPEEVTLPGGRRIASLSIGHYDTSCAVDSDGQAWCWGIGQLGAQFVVESRTPVPVEAPPGVVFESVQASWSISCGLSTIDELWCWGDVLDTGSGQTEPIRTPVKVSLPVGVTVQHFALGLDTHCLGGSDGNGYCWGSNGDGQIGVGDISRNRYTVPAQVRAPSGVTFARFAPGGDRVCALTTTGDAYCWGDNYDGSFGDDSYLDARLPRKMVIPGNESVRDLASGQYHTCIVTMSHASYCFGRGGQGELGSGTTLGGYTKRAPRVPAGVALVDIAASNSRTVALDATGRIWLWGKTDGSVRGLTEQSTTLDPLPLVGIGTPDVSDVAVSAVDAEEFTVAARVATNGSGAAVQIQYGTDPTFAQYRVVHANAPGGFGAPAEVVRRVTGLDPRTTYHVRVVASNRYSSVPTVSAPVVVSTLGDPPVVSALKVLSVGSESVSATVDVNPGRLATGVVFEVVDPSTSTVVGSAGRADLRGNSPVSVELVVEGLAPATDYLLRVAATNRLGSATIGPLAFRTIGAPPTVEAPAASAGLRSVDVTARVSTGALSTVVWARAVSTVDGAVHESGRITVGVGADGRHGLQVVGLQPRTSYVVTVWASNRAGQAVSTGVEFTTTGGRPQVSAPKASDVDRTSATLVAPVETTGLVTFAVVQVSTDPNMARNVTDHFLFYGEHQPDGRRSLTIAMLEPKSTYYARIVATNEAGTVVSDIGSFTTARPLGVEINDDADTTTLIDVELRLTAPPGSVAVSISDRSDMAGARLSLLTEFVPWRLAPSTETDVVRTVFVRFHRADGGVTDVYADSIRLVSVPVDGSIVAAASVIAQTVPPLVPAAKAKTKVSVSSKVLATEARITVRTKALRTSIVSFQVKTGSSISTHHIASASNGVYSIPIPNIRPKMQIRLVDASGVVSKWVTVKAKRK